MPKWKVYQITTAAGQAYIGVTCRNPAARLRELRSRRGIDGKLEILAEFEAQADALALETLLVPEARQGLNRARGGGGCRGLPMLGGQNPSALRVSVGGIEYETLREAAKANGVKKTTAHYRMASPYFSDWFYIDPARARYWQDKKARQTRRPAISAALRRV